MGDIKVFVYEGEDINLPEVKATVESVGYKFEEIK